MKTSHKKEIDLIELGVLVKNDQKLSNQLEDALIFTWLNEIKPEWKALNDIKLDLSEFEDWL
ncbi:MAG: hypothetical protein MUE85_01845 [Microscillaceae bacterium]|jgi:hypothetical protein|nr:hypothetical protein [Microscillaceae bacterium]